MQHEQIRPKRKGRRLYRPDACRILSVAAQHVRLMLATSRNTPSINSLMRKCSGTRPGIGRCPCLRSRGTLGRTQRDVWSLGNLGSEGLILFFAPRYAVLIAVVLLI